MDYLTLFRDHPERALDPEREYRRYREHDDTSEARATRRDQRLAKRYTETQAHTEASAKRWRQPADILDD